VWYVVKVIDTTRMSEEASLKAIEEIDLQGRCDSPHIVKYYDSFIDEEGKINIVMEYWDNGDLHSYLQTQNGYLSETNIWKLFAQIALGVQHMHAQNLLHRDLKTLNLFITSDFMVKIGDLGSATQEKCPENSQGEFKFSILAVGTPYYFSPELCWGEKYTDKCEIWSLGIILYEVCCLKRPFEGEDYDELVQNILIGKFENIPDWYSSRLSSLVQKMLHSDPDKRPPISSIVESSVYKNESSVIKFITPVIIDNTSSSVKNSFKSTNSSKLQPSVLKKSPESALYDDNDKWKLDVDSSYGKHKYNLNPANKSLSRLLTPIRKLVKRSSKIVINPKDRNFQTRVSSTSAALSLEYTNKAPNSKQKKLATYLKRLEYDKAVRKRNQSSMSKSKKKDSKNSLENSPTNSAAFTQ